MQYIVKLSHFLVTYFLGSRWCRRGCGRQKK